MFLRYSWRRSQVYPMKHLELSTDRSVASDSLGDRATRKSRLEASIFRADGRGSRDQRDERQTQPSHDLAFDKEVSDAHRGRSPSLPRRRPFARPSDKTRVSARRRNAAERGTRKGETKSPLSSFAVSLPAA